MVMRHTPIQPRSMMNEIFVVPEPERRAIERIRLDASLNPTSTIRRATTPCSGRVIQTTFRNEVREPIAIDFFAPLGQGVAASLQYYDPKSTFDRSGMGMKSYTSSQQMQHAANCNNLSGSNYYNNQNNSSVASSTSTSKNSSFAAAASASNNNNQHLSQKRSSTPPASTIRRGGNTNSSNENNNNDNNATAISFNASCRVPEHGERVFGEKSNLLSPRSFADLSMTGGGPSYFDACGKLNNTRKPSEFVGGVMQSAEWVYALRNTAVVFKNKKPPKGFRGKGKPRVVSEKKDENE